MGADHSSAPDSGVPHGTTTVSTDEIPTQSFRELGVLPATVAALSDVGITTPFPIQAMTLPVALAGSDIIGQAKTGTGKTLGFAIPIVQRVVAPSDADFDELAAPGAPQALVVVPTRELCVQVTGDVAAAAARRGIRTLSVYGGRAYEPQVDALRAGVEVVVGTPGRLLDLAQQKLLDLSHVKVLVLDEADEMLDLGFLPDVERILALTPENRQTMLFSATMPGPVISMARRYMRQPTHIRASDPKDTGATVTSTTQFVYRAHALDKVEMVARILQAEGRGLTMIFCRTKRTCAKVSDELSERGFAAAAVHGDLGQGAREQALRAFRSGKVDVLVATDVAARGIDVQDVTHVINFQCPEDEKTYLHRIGRTGRAGATGTAVTFVDWDDLPRWSLINKALDLPFTDPVETYSSSSHLYDDLRIPAGTKGVLPRGERVRAGLGAEKVEDLGETGKRSRDGGAAGGRRAAARGSSSSTQETGVYGGDEGRDEPTRPDEAPGRPRRSRSRRRTRGGHPVAEETVVNGGATADGTSAHGADRTTADEPSASATAGEPGTDDGEPRRRRRRRGGRGRSGSTGEEATAAAGADTSGEPGRGA